VNAGLVQYVLTNLIGKSHDNAGAGAGRIHSAIRVGDWLIGDMGIGLGSSLHVHEVNEGSKVLAYLGDRRALLKAIWLPDMALSQRFSSTIQGSLRVRKGSMQSRFEKQISAWRHVFLLSYFCQLAGQLADVE
jgi:hypothetical protein